MDCHSRQRGRLRPPLFFCASGGRPGACRRHSTPRFGPECVPGHAKRPRCTPRLPGRARAGSTTEHTPVPGRARYVPRALPLVRPGGPDHDAHPDPAVACCSSGLVISLLGGCPGVPDHTWWPDGARARPRPLGRTPLVVPQPSHTPLG